MVRGEHTRRGLGRKAALALALLCLVAVVPATLALAAPRAHASGSCSGSITVRLAGKKQTARQIKTMKVSCAAGKRVLHSFLQRAASHSGCRKAAGKPPPTTGCVVSGYHCFLNRTPDYCATVSGREVEWRLRPSSTRG
jgi:hypothetical protein